jgi:hypothetical protein
MGIKRAVDCWVLTSTILVQVPPPAAMVLAATMTLQCREIACDASVRLQAIQVFRFKLVVSSDGLGSDAAWLVERMVHHRFDFAAQY